MLASEGQCRRLLERVYVLASPVRDSQNDLQGDVVLVLVEDEGPNHVTAYICEPDLQPPRV